MGDGVGSDGLFPSNSRMNDALELLELLGVLKDNLSQGLSIERTVCMEDHLTKMFFYLLPGNSAWFDDIAG